MCLEAVRRDRDRLQAQLDTERALSEERRQCIELALGERNEAQAQLNAERQGAIAREGALEEARVLMQRGLALWDQMRPGVPLYAEEQEFWADVAAALLPGLPPAGEER